MGGKRQKTGSNRKNIGVFFLASAEPGHILGITEFFTLGK